MWTLAVASCGALKKLEQFVVHGLVAGDDRAGLHHRVVAVDVADKSAGFAYQQESSSDIPRRDVALPIGIDAAGRDPGEVKGGRSKPAQPGNLVRNGLKLTAEEREVAASAVRQPAGKHR